MVTVRDLVQNNEKYEVVWGEHNTVETMRLIVVPNTNAMGAFMFKVRRRLSAYNVQDSNTNILYAEVSFTVLHSLDYKAWKQKWFRRNLIYFPTSQSEQDIEAMFNESSTAFRFALIFEDIGENLV